MPDPWQPVEELSRAASGPFPPWRRHRFSTYLADMPSNRFLARTKTVALSLTREFFNWLLVIKQARNPMTTMRLPHGQPSQTIITGAL